MAQDIPAKMSAIGFDQPGGPEVMRPGEADVPQPGMGEVLIRVAYAGVNRPDVIQRMGLYPAPPGASPILGLEVSGTVVAIGEGVEPEWLNRIVCALTPGGG
ncbi:MAG: alcohol dehydrogenase catalytic domain-containing protein, partial [Sphingomonadaceae bacterium]|nr:alcohol dehydrogenase catalytic domain-containing protein [Sphingomonadaceae bacterium]